MSPRIAMMVALVFVGSAMGCGSKQQAVKPVPLPEPETAGAVDTPASEPPGASREELNTIPPPPSVPTQAEGWVTDTEQSTAETTFGYRVQIFASASAEGADAIASEARGRFPEEVHVQFEPPFYKVRVGDCVTRHEAERLKDRAAEMGYEGPFIAETSVAVR